MNYSSSTIPYAEDLSAPTDLLCFTGWSLVQSAVGMSIFCNDTITNVLWQMEVPGGGMKRNDPLPPPSFNWTIPYTPVGLWYVFGDCTFEIIQCNATHAHHNYSEVEDVEEYHGCPTNVVATYHVCVNAAVININLRPTDNRIALPTGNPDVWLYNDILPPSPCPSVPAEVPIDIYLHNNFFDVLASVVGMVADLAALPMIAVLLITVLYLVWVFVLRKPKYNNRYSSEEMSNL